MTPNLQFDHFGVSVQFWLSPLRFLLELVEKPHHRHVFSPPNP
jgi:hypothetical protein